MDQAFLRPDVLPPSVPTAAIGAAALLALALWCGIRQIGLRRRWPIAAQALCSALVGAAALWTALQFVARFVFFSCGGGLPTWALFSSVCLEAVLRLYAKEAASVKNARRRIAIKMCRASAVAVLLFVLLQPVYVGETVRTVRRRVVVLLDDSASMHLPDKWWTSFERLDTAKALGLVSPEGEVGVFDRGFASPFAAIEVAFSGIGADGAAEGADDAKSAEQARETLQKAREALETLAERLAASGRETERATLVRLAAFISSRATKAVEDFVSSSGAARRKNAMRVAETMRSLCMAAGDADEAISLATMEGLDENVRASIDSFSGTERADIVARLLSAGSCGGKPVLDALAEKYDVDVFRFASRLEGAVDEPSTNGVGVEAARTEFRSATDMVKAVETAIAEIPFDEIAGLLIFTDGRHNGEAGVDAVARRLGDASIPACSVVVGGSGHPRDISIADFRAPESVFVGDKVRLAATVAASGMRGKSIVVRWSAGDETLETTPPVFIESDSFSREFKFSRVSDTPGIVRYGVSVEPVDGEEFLDNNAWHLDVATDEARTFVLLADDRPRWEFRYLRNLFRGRDKSVHLQEFLAHPDRVAGEPVRQLPPASAARPFGDTEAGALPASRDEWSAFDVIILGDLDETVITPQVVADIRYCVEERGAMLVVIDGPKAMPHHFVSGPFGDILPIESGPSISNWMPPPESSFKLKLSPAGRGHEIMNQSPSSYESERIWNEMPPLFWRQPSFGVKAGAEILAWAEPEGSEAGIDAARLAASRLGQGGAGDALKILDNLRKRREKSALVVASSFGRGKVLQLAFDGTWRLRYRAGDVFQHRFWGQVLKWGTGEKLRGGNAWARLGTDKLRYEIGEKISVKASFRNRDLGPIAGLKPEATILDEEGNEIRHLLLTPVPDISGSYEVRMDPMPQPGRWTVALSCPAARRALGSDYPERLQTVFSVVEARSPAEFSDVSASSAIPSRLAAMTGGICVLPSRLEETLECFGEGTRKIAERRELNLWASPWLFFLTIALLAAEWILRKASDLR